jgi:hypothetical protein
MNLTSKQDAAVTSAPDRAREAILALLLPLQQQAAALREDLAQIDLEQTPLEAALAALDEESRARSKAPTKTKKPFVTQADVQSVCQTLLNENRSLSLNDLKVRAKEKLSREQGFNLNGFGLRFKECLASSTFSMSSEGVVTLADIAASRAARSVVDNPTRRALVD